MSKNNSSTGQDKKQRDFIETLAKKKRYTKKAQKYGEKYFTEGTKERMPRCRQKVWVWTDATMTKRKCVACESCQSPWCSMCGWFKSKKDALRIATCMKWIQLEKGKAFLFLTLTAPNVTGDKLKEEITRYNKNFKKLMDRREVLRVVKGYVRKLEVTYNKEPKITKEMWYGNKEKHIKAQGYYFESRGLKIGDPNPNFNTYHPHFHVLIAVNKSYFTGSRDYISPARWLELWREAMDDQSITQVKAIQVTFNSGKEINEIAKYAAKDEDYLHSQGVFDVFYGALNRRQKMTYSGLFTEASEKYRKKELDDYKDKDLTEYVYELLYRWDKAKGEYSLEDVRELTAEERAAAHGQTIEEMDIEE